MSNSTPEAVAKPGDMRGMRYLTLICVAASLAGLLFGFDTAVVSGAVGFVSRQFSLTPLWEGAFASSALVGCLLGVAMAGVSGDRFGRRPVLKVSAMLFLLSGLGSAIPPTYGLLVAARVVCGLSVGLASVAAPMYISEFAPPKWRGRMVSFYQLSIVTGILLAYSSNWAILRFAREHAASGPGAGIVQWLFVNQCWRGMLGVEALPAALFLGLLFFVPESPRWLLRAGRDDEALAVLSQIDGVESARQQLEAIKLGPLKRDGSLAELFRPGLRTALLVGVMLSVFGQLSGVNIVIYYGPKILAAAGYHDLGALLGQVGFGLINLVFTIIALLLIDTWGRRPLLIGGMAMVTLTLAVTGGMFRFGGGGAKGVSPAIGLWIGAIMCLYIACIALSICAVIWVLTPEIFPDRVRSRGVAISTFANWSTNAFSALVFPLYTTRFGMHTFFFTTAAICLIATVFFWKFVPETQGRSLEEIERMWTPQASPLIGQGKSAGLEPSL